MIEHWLGKSTKASRAQPAKVRKPGSALPKEKKPEGTAGKMLQTLATMAAKLYGSGG